MKYQPIITTIPGFSSSLSVENGATLGSFSWNQFSHTLTIKPGLAAGTYKLTINQKDFREKKISLPVTVKVVDNTAKTVAVKSVKTLSKANVAVGKSIILPSIITPDNASNKVINWSTSDNKIAKVNSNGKVTGKKAGKAKITATTKDGSKISTCTVTVSKKAVKLKSVKITPSKSKGLLPGKTLQIKTNLIPANATGIIAKYQSSNTKVATVNSLGKVTAKAAGKATITVTTGKLSTKVKITVGTVAASKITLKKSKLTIKKGKSKKLSVKKITPTSTKPKTVTWTSSNKKIATVNSKGVVKAKKKGTATITVTTWNGKTAKCKITVK